MCIPDDLGLQLSGCTTDTHHGVTETDCFCTTNLCNNANTFKIQNGLVIPLTVFAALIVVRSEIFCSFSFHFGFGYRIKSSKHQNKKNKIHIEYSY